MQAKISSLFACGEIKTPFRYTFVKTLLACILCMSVAGSVHARIIQAVPAVSDTLVRSESANNPDAGTPSEPQDDSLAHNSIVEALEGNLSDPAVTSCHRLAIKTNLLYDAALMPSLEVEYRIDDRWSVNLEGDAAWWSKKPEHKYYQIATISPEARYWFGMKKPWHGHYIGAFVGGGWYDLENGRHGYKGELVMTGLSYGYMFPVGRRLSFEAGIGIGFLHTSYEEYLPIDGHYVYQRTRQTNYVGPLKLKFALVWRLWNCNGKGGVR